MCPIPRPPSSSLDNETCRRIRQSMLNEAQAPIQFGPLAPTGHLTPGAPTTLGTSSLPRVCKSQAPTKGGLQTERRERRERDGGDAGRPCGQQLSCGHGGEEEAVAYEQTSVPQWCRSGATSQGPALLLQQEARWLDRENIWRVGTMDVQRLPARAWLLRDLGLRAPAWLRLRDGSGWRAWREGKCPVLGKPSL